MNILVAPDKFRGSLEATEVCLAIKVGILLAFPHANIITVPLADGGEGTSEILTRQAGGEHITLTVSDPLGRKISAGYGFSSETQTAYIEMAAASGLNLLSPQERNPSLTSSYGTGELIRDALDRHAKKIVLGIGGSATTDGGIGMAAALGYRFYDDHHELLAPNGAALNSIRHIDISQVDERINFVSVTVACDVTNPLYGRRGAAYIYGPQKGADGPMLDSLDKGLKNLSDVATRTFGRNVSHEPGAGAAGGMGAGCMWFLHATLKDGVGIVMEQSNMTKLIAGSDLVITGEGKVDEQTLNGKVVKGLADMCGKFDVPLAVVCGTLQITPEQSRAAGITYLTSVLNRPMGLNVAEKEAFGLIKDATFNLVRLFFARRN
ncbi:glycerate kinase [Dyadobacter luticola]|uniref:Glycerate kinase n=1 Tax=Dyadobacter luticola TaxID=1979387 RepID=A0A5R9KXX0_9BACT|nr:glycerate kinase [Dyadobacter luticola]TLV01162.1 glycerate kinase [Dyadobacter luticola]